MIYPRNYKLNPRLGMPNAEKETILAFLKRPEPCAICEGYVKDLKTGKAVKGIVDADYQYDELYWYEEDTYNFEFNDMELSPEFCARVMELIRQG